jgi:hypothetical protein
MSYTAEGVRVPSNPVPLERRKSWTLPQAAHVYGIDYAALRLAANTPGQLETFRPLSKRGTVSWRRVRAEEMDRWVKEQEQ